MLSVFKQYRKESFSPIYPDRSIRLHTMLVNCGYQWVDQESYFWDGLKRGSRELGIWQYTISGCGRLRMDQQEYLLPPGHAMLVQIPEPHCYYFTRDCGHWEFCFISINGSEMVRLWPELRRLLGGPVAKHRPESPSLKLATEIYAAGHEGKINSQFEASSLAYRFLMTLFDEFKEGGVEGGQPEFITRVREFALKNVGRELSVNELAEVAGFSRYHFIRQFHKYQGMAPMEFVNDLKMRLAIRLLQTEQLTVKEVADRCGFSSVSYFCKVFRKYQGKAPAQFRDYR